MNIKDSLLESTDTRDFAQSVKARLLPPSAAGKVLEMLVELLPRRIMAARLLPEREVVVRSPGGEEYQATGESPRMALEFPLPPQTGWYFIEGALVQHNGSREAFIEVITDGGSAHIPIPSTLRGSITEVVRLPRGVKRLYWIPTAAEGYFTQSPLLIHKISTIESILRRAYRVVLDLWRFRDRQPDSRAGLTWGGLLWNLQDAYGRTAALRIQRFQGMDYASFIRLNDTPSASSIHSMRRQAANLPRQPLISLIMPLLHAEDAARLRTSIESVAGQIYPRWELLLAASDEVEETARRLVSMDSRIRLLPSAGQMNGGSVAGLFNAGIAVAQGEFAFRINAGDKLPAHALYCLSVELNTHPSADFIYSDDDAIDERGERSHPRFKPDWNPDLLASCHYLGNMSAYRLERLRKVGGYRPGFEGAEAYDLALRFTSELADAAIRHIPRVLYHAALTGAGTEAAPFHMAGKRALQAHFNGTGVTVEDGQGEGLYHAKYPLPDPLPLASIIIPTRDKAAILRTCIESILRETCYENWEMLVVDNQSSETDALEFLKEIRKDSRIRVLDYDQPFNYSAINNYAAKHARGEVLILLNNDVEVITPDWLGEMVSQAVRPGIGAVGAKLLYANGRVQHAGVITGVGGVAGHGHKYIRDDEQGYCHRAVVVQNLTAVTGACLAVNKAAYEEVGGLNETHLKIALNDVDFCLKLTEAGYRNLYTPYAKLFHHESMSRGRDDTPEKHAQFLREAEYMKCTWGGRLKRDPAYNPNLTLEFENFSLSSQRIEYFNE
jgi:GT2 family glycosyltransferase